ncbi:Caspase-8 [Triplophysa tibetana]|uniref:Caspase-8 n=1 Tax=Triplophysa tibetana TaxID=1572043 RepID=A0A5A9NSZ8_9TELE|nr:Caspase-8 [Triplophysa tibetana]
MATNSKNRERIREHKVFLVETLCEEADVILQHAHQEKLITPREYRNLKDVVNREKMTIDLLDKLMSKGEETCCNFVQILGNADILETYPSLVGHAIIAHPGKTQEQIGQYTITQIPRGTCVIINNVHFGSMKEREGSDEDQKSLDRVFSWLGFTVLVHKDKTAAQMRDLLKDLGRTVNGDCFVCCILSHGRSDGVYGTDKNIVSVDEIREPFNGSNCRNLAGKPKLFFIQACRGSNSHNVVRVQADDPEGAESELEVDAERMEVLIPVDSDFLIARSTIDRYYSFRDTMKGSWFIQSLCKQLETHCPQGTDIQTILLAVNHDVSREGVTRKQMPVHEVAMGKKLILHVPNVQ